MIYVDADACPVKAEVIKVAERHKLKSVFVANIGMRPSRDPMIEHVTVSGAFDAADDWIVEHAESGDVAVTSDVPLAARLVANGVHTTSHSGKLFTEDTIGSQSAMRDFNQYLREAGEIKGYNAPFSTKDRSQFLQSLDLLIHKAKTAKA